MRPGAGQRKACGTFPLRRIQHSADFVDPYGKSRVMHNPADGLFEVVQVFEDGAIISSQNKYSPFNVQIGDLAVLE